MTEISRRYRVIAPVMMTIIDGDGRETLDYIISPGDGEFSFNGSDIIYHDASGKTFTTINVNNFIDLMLEQRRLEPS